MGNRRWFRRGFSTPGRGRATADQTAYRTCVREVMALLSLLVLVVFGLAGCQQGGTAVSMSMSTTTTHSMATPRSDDWTPLRQRPLRLPTLAAGAVCPINHARQVTSQFGLAVGDGPVYAVIADGGVLTYGPPGNFQSREWGGQKVLWFAQFEVHGPILIRGHQLDGPNEVRFEYGDVPPLELTFTAGGAGTDSNHWTNVPTYTRVRAPGCYAYQVDGPDFTEVIIFEARPQTS